MRLLAADTHKKTIGRKAYLVIYLITGRIELHIYSVLAQGLTNQNRQTVHISIEIKTGVCIFESIKRTQSSLYYNP